MKNLEKSNEKKFKRNIKIINRFIQKSLAEYHINRGILLNYSKYHKLKDEVNEIIRNKGEWIQFRQTVYILDNYKHFNDEYDDKAIIIGNNSIYAYNFHNCSFKNCKFYLTDLDTSLIFDNSKVENCEIIYVGSQTQELSFNDRIWQFNNGGSIHISFHYTDSEIDRLDYLFGDIDNAVVSISGDNSKISNSSIISKKIEFGDADHNESTFIGCRYFGDLITMTLLNNKYNFLQCHFMIYKINEIEYFRLNDLLEVIKRMIYIEMDDKRLDALKIIYDLMYNSDSDVQTWFGVIFGQLRLPKVIIKNCVKSIIMFAIIYMIIGIENNGVIKYELSLSASPLLLLKNFFNAFIEALYFSCCTFTTVGYGDYNINSSISIFKIIPIFQMILGYIFSGVLIGSFYHKLSSNRYLESRY